MEEDKPVVSFDIGRKLCDINLAIKYFLHQFREFRKSSIVDECLGENLSMLVEEIDSFLDSEPIEVQSPKLSNYEVDLEANNLELGFYCRVCQIKVAPRVHTIDKHLHSEKHLNALQAVAKVEVKQKKKEKAKAKEKKEEPPRMTLFKKMKSFVRSDYIKYVTDAENVAGSLIQIPAYTDIRKSLRKELCKTFPNVKIYFFGSRINGLGNIDSDLDIYVDIDNSYHKRLDTDQMKSYVQQIRGILESTKTGEWRNFVSIASARTPILKLYNTVHRIDCDISFASLGDANTFLLKYFFDQQPLTRQMCLFIKKWAKTASYAECFSSYVYTLMVIFYFQQHNRLPSVFVLQGCVSPYLVGPWQTNFANIPLEKFEMKPVENSIPNLRKELVSFFSFYAKLDYDKYIIAPFTGTLVERKNFNKMTDVFARYHHNHASFSKKDLLQLERPICIQDPLEHNHNVAKGMTRTVLKAFIDDCRLTACELQAQITEMEKSTQRHINIMRKDPLFFVYDCLPTDDM